MKTTKTMRIGERKKSGRKLRARTSFWSLLDRTETREVSLIGKRRRERRSGREKGETKMVIHPSMLLGLGSRVFVFGITLRQNLPRIITSILVVILITWRLAPCTGWMLFGISFMML
uniref:Uncharacterized protein n=1 Tax=Opuntia streptacantha TaxID=393608 RepID=A0A7C9DKR6_OPUST